MCGIVGMIGEELTVKKLVEALKKLEYRGYDSAGVAFSEGESLNVVKAVGKIVNLENTLGEEINRTIIQGIAHTRWATHGSPSDFNAHPHTDCTGKIAVVHNGIIENFDQLKSRLEKGGHLFKSATDTEVIAHLLEEYYEGDLLAALKHALVDLKGAYAIGAIHQDQPELIVAARKGSPLVVASTPQNAYMASDVTPLLKYVRELFFMEDGELASLRAGRVELFGLDGKPLKRKPTEIAWNEASAEKGGYPHFMLKEIYEEPQSIRNALIGRIRNGLPRLAELEALGGEIGRASGVTVLACGTSYHAGLIFQRFLREHTRFRTEIEVASEFRYSKVSLGERDLVIAISQSGETADTLEGVRKARAGGAKVIALTNVVGSTLSRESEAVVYLNSGPEIGVAATKTYVAQLAVLFLLACELAVRTGTDGEAISQLVNELEGMPTVFENVLSSAEDQCKRLAREYSGFEHFVYMGRGYGYPTALEGALKLKEISYIHASAYQAGELKHGPIALLDRNFPVLAVVPEDELKIKMLSNIMETRAREAKVLALCTENDREVARAVNSRIEVPRVSDPLYAMIIAPYLQLFAYHVALFKNLDPDRPRNLAKSVTVE